MVLENLNKKEYYQLNFHVGDFVVVRVRERKENQDLIILTGVIHDIKDTKFFIESILLERLSVEIDDLYDMRHAVTVDSVDGDILFKPLNTLLDYKNSGFSRYEKQIVLDKDIDERVIGNLKLLISKNQMPFIFKAAFDKQMNYYKFEGLETQVYDSDVSRYKYCLRKRLELLVSIDKNNLKWLLEEDKTPNDDDGSLTVKEITNSINSSVILNRKQKEHCLDHSLPYAKRGSKDE